MDIWQYIVIIAVMVVLSAYFSATETAFSSLNKTRLKAMAENGNKRAALALKLSENYDKLISTILIGNNIVNIAASSIGTLMFVDLMRDQDLGATVSTVVITVVVLIFGEITPKSIAKDSPERFAMFSSPAIRVLIWILTPINFVFSQWKKLVSKIFKSEDNTKMSQEELLMLVEEVEQEGSLDTDEGELIRNAIEFSERQAEDILTHRVDLEGFAEGTDKAEIAKLFTETQFSRLLVYNESVDDIIGFIHLKDFLTPDGITDKPVKDIMAKPVFIQKSEKVNDILKILQQNKSHIAVVIDEYGGTLGIVTMEDILEELVGEIWDEHDEVVLEFESLGENAYKVDCSANFEGFCELFEIEAETESISVGGWVMEQLGKMPEVGDKFEFGNLEIEITETDTHRVNYVNVLRREQIEETVE